MARMLTVQEVADYLKVTPRTVRAWIKEGKLKGVKLGRVIRVWSEDLEDFIN